MGEALRRINQDCNIQKNVGRGRVQNWPPTFDTGTFGQKNQDDAKHNAKPSSSYKRQIGHLMLTKSEIGDPIPD
ncbi:CFF_HP2_G0007160.mRNA.1.CDS.1 [Saccharomyces cerevisiae]|nr:CFF_HP2_G0007160.mRNA.1.CDS.1 [Saccharomyces cerevisiae]CAI6405208.1 CFF_HP2_G0007160.mRNA.1.CDS.1 [Saccharomyces cerevisiae]